MIPSNPLMSDTSPQNNIDGVKWVFRDSGIPGIEKTYWGIRILNAARRGGFTCVDLTEAQCWITCACGRADPSIERIVSKFPDLNGAPVDRDLRGLGQEFPHAVAMNQFGQAAELLVAIEKRAIQALLAQRVAAEEYELPMGGLG